MALNSMGLGVTFTARDAMSGALFRMQRAFSGLELSSRTAVAAVGAGFASMAAGIAVAVAGLAGLETGMALASKSAAFEAAITRVGLVAGASDEQVVQLGNAALDAAQRTGYGTSEIAKGLEEIAALGFSAEESLMMLGPALDLAASGGIGVAEAAEAMGSAMKVFSLEANSDNMGKVSDQLVGIANITGLQASDLRIALGTVGRGASAAKQQLDEVLIMMGLVKNTGVDATVAASSVSSALLFMAENAKKFRKLGIEVEDANGKVRKMGDIFLDLNEVLKKNPHMTENISIVKDLLQRFGITAYQGVTEQLGSGNIKNKDTGQGYKDREALAYMRERMAEFDTDDLAQKNAAKMLATYEGLTGRLKVVWDTLLIGLGVGFKEVLVKPLEWIVEGLQNLERFLRSLPDEVKMVGAAIFLLGSAMAVASGMALILAGAITIVGAVVILAGAPLLAWLGGMLLLAIPLVIVASALAAAFVAFGAAIAFVFTKNLGGATDKLLAFYNKWKLIIAATTEFLSKGELSGALMDEFLGADEETQNIVKRFFLFFEKLKVGFFAMTDTFTTLLEGKAVPALQAVWREFMTLTDLLGLTDNAYGRMGEAMTKGDWETQGKLMGETLANAFFFIADALIFVIKLLYDFLEVMSLAWRWKFTLIGAATMNPATIMAGLAADMAVEGNRLMDEKELAERGGKPGVSAERLYKLENELSVLKWRSHGNGPVPAATQVAATAEAQQQGYEWMFKEYADIHDKREKIYTIDNRLYIDGQVVYEAVKRVAKEEGTSSSLAEGVGGYSGEW